MRTISLALVMSLGLATGCSTVKSGLSALGGGKPHQVTVVNSIEAAQPQVVVLEAAPEPALVTEPTPGSEAARPKRNTLRTIRGVASGAVAGALFGTALGYAAGGVDGAAKGAALGAGAGALGGAIASQ